MKDSMERRLRIVIHAANPAPLRESVASRHPDVELAECDSYKELPAVLDDFRPDVLFSIRFAGTRGYPRDDIFRDAGPRWIAVGGSGVDHLGTWDPAQVTVTNSAGVAAEAMAEYVIGGLLHFSLDVPGLNADKQSQNWNARKITPLRGRRLLIIGLGKTGTAVARLAKAFGMHVTGVRASGSATPHVDEVHKPAALQSCWSKADHVVVCVPLTDSTRGLIGRNAFQAMNKTTVIVDVSRGGIVEEEALIAALQSRRIAGAVLDVFETEPLPADNPLWKLENVLISPHCSSVYDGWELASIDLFCNNLARWSANRPLTSVVMPPRN